MGFQWNVRRILSERKMTHDDLARKIGCCRSHVSRTINPDSNPRLSTMAEIAAALGVDLEELMR